MAETSKEIPDDVRQKVLAAVDEMEVEETEELGPDQTRYKLKNPDVSSWYFAYST